jgi:hypothetical protein
LQTIAAADEVLISNQYSVITKTIFQAIKD